MSRPRNRQTRDLPPGLYARTKGGKSYFAYRHPDTGKEIGIGTDRRKAVEAVHIVIARRATAAHGAAQLASRLLTGGMTFHTMLDGWFAYWTQEQSPAKGTVVNEKGRISRIKRGIPDINVLDVHLAMVTAFLDNVDSGQYEKYRSTLDRAFAWGIAKGHLKENHPKQTLRRKTPARERSRLTAEQYDVIYQHASPHLQIGMELIRLSLQRPGDLCSTRAAAWDGSSFKIIQSKTGTRLEIKPHAELATALDRAVQYRVDTCDALICYEPDARARSATRVGPDRRHWAQCTRDTLQNEFKKLFSKHIPGVKHPPTLYECKALGSHQYKKAGWETTEIQDLAAHEESSTTEIYLADHEEWTQVDLSAKSGPR